MVNIASPHTPARQSAWSSTRTYSWFPAKISVQRSSVPVGSFGVPGVTGGVDADCCEGDPPVRICAPLRSTLVSIPKYQLISPIVMTAPIPRPPARLR